MIFRSVQKGDSERKMKRDLERIKSYNSTRNRFFQSGAIQGYYLQIYLLIKIYHHVLRGSGSDQWYAINFWREYQVNVI